MKKLFMKVCFISFMALVALLFAPWSLQTAWADTGSYPVNGGSINFDATTGAVTGYSSSPTTVIIPDTIDGVPVTSIGNSAFSGCTSLSSISVPVSVSSIGDYAFSACTNLTSATILGKVTSIESCTFLNCNNLTSVTLPSSLTSIGMMAFYYCPELTDINIPSSVTSIGDYAFESCSSLPSITIPSGVNNIGERVFDGCSKLASVTISKGVSCIGYREFHNCSSITSVTIPGSVISIGDNAFQGCSSLKGAYFLGNAPTSFGGYVFVDCDSAFTIYYYPGTTGWTTPTWNGYQTKEITQTTTINTAAIAGVTAPALGATPVSTIADTSEYTATISWSPSDATFAPSTVYIATITITPKDGYTLRDVPENFFTVAGATATNAAGSGIVTAVFPKTEAVTSNPSGSQGGGESFPIFSATPSFFELFGSHLF